MSPQPFRILVVDDQAAVVWALSGFLKRAGYEVSQAGEAELALAALEYDRPHFVIAIDEHDSFESASQMFGDCRLEIVPVVDADGMLLGTIRRQDLSRGHAAPPFPPRAITEAISTDAVCYEEATVQTLYEFFQHEEQDRVEITDGGRPTGYVTRGALAALGRPLGLDSFAQGEPELQGSAALLVADLDVSS